MLAGYESEAEIPIIVTGLRDGERLHERLVAADEELVPVGEEKMLLARSSEPIPAGLEKGIDTLIAHAAAGERERILEDLSELVPGFGAADENANGPRECAT